MNRTLALVLASADGRVVRYLYAKAQPAKDRGDDPGVMIALHLGRRTANKLAVPGGEAPDQHHVTLAYLGRRSKLGEGIERRAAMNKIRAALARVSAASPPLKGNVSGVGRFSASDSSDGKDVIYAGADVPGLAELRQRVVDALKKEGVEYSKDHGFTPHVTLAYVDPKSPSPVDRIEHHPLGFGEVVLTVGDERTAFPLIGRLAYAMPDRNRLLYAKSTPVVFHHGNVVSAHAKSGDSACSAAASAWRLKKADASTFKTLAMCRSKARARSDAGKHRAAGNEAKAQTLEHRATTGKVGHEHRKALALALTHVRTGKQLSRAVRQLDTTPIDPIDAARRVLANRVRFKTNMSPPVAEDKPDVLKGIGITHANYGGKNHFIFKDGHKEIGEIAFVPRSSGGFEVSNVQVWPESQKKGYATAFYRHAADEAKKLGGKLYISDDRTTAAKALHARMQAKGEMGPDGEVLPGKVAPSPPRKIKLKPTTTEHKTAVKEVASALDERGRAEASHRQTADPMVHDLMHRQAEGKYRTAQDALKALKTSKLKAAKDARIDAAMAALPGGGKRSSEEYTGKIGPTRGEAPTPKPAPSAPAPAPAPSHPNPKAHMDALDAEHKSLNDQRSALATKAILEGRRAGSREGRTAIEDRYRPQMEAIDRRLAEIKANRGELTKRHPELTPAPAPPPKPEYGRFEPTYDPRTGGYYAGD